jgi:hypothetical protein
MDHLRKNLQRLRRLFPGDGEQAQPPGPDAAALQARITKLETEIARLKEENGELIALADSKARELRIAGWCRECGEMLACPRCA